MAKADKKLQKLKERLAIMEADLLNALTKKTSSTSEINVPEYTRKIKELKAQIALG